MGRRFRLLACVMLVAVLGACTEPAAGPVPTLTSSPPLPIANPPTDALTCSDAIDVLDTPPADMPTVLGVVALPTQRVLQAEPNSGGTGPATRYFAKQGLVVRVGATVDLRIGTGATSHARIGWGNPGPIRDHVHAEVTDCPGVPNSRWVAFAGGYYVDQPQCVALIVEYGGERATVPISVGAPCPSR